ncbi:MAG TPA: alpha-ketoglutarate-dependent dioxygenase AlkB [Bacteroidia bacterium]|nr:alpha-ketoglutarate-dependent dioxygenase AlkB [Bacteroidia bacterium]
MKTLFDIEPEFPAGFIYSPAFLNTAEESDLHKAILKLDLQTVVFRGFEAKRKVMSFGYDYHFNNRSISPGIPIPEDFYPLIQKTANYLKIPSYKFEELLVTAYPPGSVINWHRDAPPFELIAGISLLSDCNFKLRPYQKNKQVRGSTISIPVQRCSLYVMQGEVREEWEHSISETKTLRYSITLRTLRQQF